MEKNIMHELSIYNSEEFEGLIEEMRDIYIEYGKRGRTLGNRMRIALGEAVVSSPLYKKRGEGLIESVAKQIGKSEETVYLWVRFYENRSKFEDLEMPWRKVVSKLQNVDDDVPKRTLAPSCKHCPLHCL